MKLGFSGGILFLEGRDFMAGKYEIDMCNGSLFSKIIKCALPMMATSILQLLYNAVDIIVVGRYVGETALAAVGSTGNSTGPHLHLEIRVNGVAKNPQNYVY